MSRNLIAVMILGFVVFASSMANAQVFASFVDESETSWTGAYGGLHMGHGWGDLDDSLECPGVNELNPVTFDDTLAGSITLNTHVGGTQTTYCNATDQHPNVGPPPFGTPMAFTGMDRDGPNTTQGNPIWVNDDLDQNIDGWSGGVQLGFLYQVSRVVFGVEVSGSVTNMSDTGVVSAFLPATVFLLCGPGNLEDCYGTYEWKTDINAIWTSVARAGFAITPDILISVKGGLAFAQIDFEAAGDKDSNTVEGWTVGVQGDVRLTKNTSAFISYDHMGFDDVKFRTQQDFLVFHNVTYHEYDYDIDQIKFGFNYHFN
jgi:opacity protein-like surface antigen